MWRHWTSPWEQPYWILSHAFYRYSLFQNRKLTDKLVDQQGREWQIIIAIIKQEDQDGPGSLTWFFEIALAIFFCHFQRRIYKNFFMSVQCNWLTEWCFTPLLTVFQSYHSDSSHYSCFPGFHQYYAGLWSVLPKDTPMKKPRGSSSARTQDPGLWVKHFTNEPRVTLYTVQEAPIH